MIKNFKFRVLNRLNFLKYNFYFKRVIIHNRNWNIPVVDKMGYSYTFSENTEEWIYDFLNKLFDSVKIDFFIDVGVNVGQTLLKVKSIDPSMPYYGIEPNINCAYYVKQLIEINQLINTEIICAASGQKEKEILSLTYNGISDTRATTSMNENTPKDMRHNSIVPVISINGLFDGIKSNFQNIVIKIDVEGGELDVLKGASKVLLKHNPIVVFEVLPHQKSKSVIEQQDSLFKFFQKIDYEIFRISQTGHIQRISDFNNFNNFKLIDYIAISQSMRDILLKI